jgi:hypothetical protein
MVRLQLQAKGIRIKDLTGQKERTILKVKGITASEHGIETVLA